MAHFRTEAIERFAHELGLAPARLRAQHVQAARQVVPSLDPDQDYPRSYIVFRITGYRTRQPVEIELCGRDLIADLVLLLERVTLASPLPPTEEANTLLDAAALCERWSISSKTLDRWRALGLMACWYAPADEPKRLLFTRSEVEWFESRHADRVNRARAYRRLDDPGRRALARRALELVSQRGCSLSEATQLVADEVGRACETVRLAVHRYREELAAESPGIAPDAPTEDPAVAIYRALQAGASPAALAEREGCLPEEIDAQARLGRARHLAAAPIKYIFDPEYDHPEAERRIFASLPDEGEEPPVAEEPPATLPAYLRDLYRVPLLTPAEERSLFRQYNYLLHRAELARRFLAGEEPSELALDHLDTLLARAHAIKNRLIASNLRLVVSIARRHVGRVPGWDLFDLASEGNTAVIRSVEAFDVARGNKFSTYATWAITRHFARVLARACHEGEHYRSGGEAVWSIVEEAADRAPAEAAADADEPQARRLLVEMLADLDPREREIVERRFGLAERTPQTLQEVSAAVRLSRERVRQIERDVLDRLRGALVERGVTAAEAV